MVAKWLNSLNMK